jgi:hypothetical protein
MDMLGKYERLLPIEENPTGDYYIRALNDSEESVRVPFDKVGQNPDVVVDFWAFLGGVIQQTNFLVSQNQEVVFEDRVYSPELVLFFKWTIQHVDSGASTTSYQKILTHSFSTSGWYSITLEAFDSSNNLIGSKTKASHILVTSTVVPLYTVNFHVTSDGTDIEGALVSLNLKAQLTNSDGEVSFSNVGPGTYGWKVTKDDYLPRSGVLEVVDGDEDVSVVLELEDSGPGIPASPVYLGYLTEPQWASAGEALTEAIINGETFPSQHLEVDTSTNNAEFPDKLDAKWSDEFPLSPFLWYYQFVAIPESTVDSQIYVYFRNMGVVDISDLFEKIGEWTYPEVNGETYYVYRLFKAAPTKITLSINPF